MAARRVIVQPDPARTAAVPAQQVGRHATFIEKHVLAHVAERLPGSPLPTLRRDVSASLFLGVDGFF